MSAEPIVASMATIPGRESQCQQAIASLTPQVDMIEVYVNSPRRPDAARYRPATVTWAGNSVGDLGDAGKVTSDLDNTDIYTHLLVDDDIIYPPDYVAQLQAALDRHPGAVVGVHGKQVVQPIQSYYRSLRVFHCAHALAHDTLVHVLGTGTVAYRTTTLRLHHTQFPVPNMADIWLALLCHRLAIPRIAIARPAGWLQVLPAPHSIWEHAHRDDTLQTLLMRRVDWPKLEP